MNTAPTATARRPAFTLVELAIVLMIVGILSAIAAPRYADSLHRYRADAAARRIAADLQLARDRAITSSESRTVSFTSSDAYTLPEMSDPDRPAQVYTVRIAAEPYRARVVSADFGGDREVIFDGYGVSDSGGSVTVQAGQAQRTVTLDPDSGKVEVE